MNSRLEIDGTKLPPFIAAKNLEIFINQDLMSRTELIKYEGAAVLIELEYAKDKQDHDRLRQIAQHVRDLKSKVTGEG